MKKRIFPSRAIVMLDCTAALYALRDETIIEYNFGYTDQGDAIGGLISFSIRGDVPCVTLYRHKPVICIRVQESPAGKVR